MPKLANAGTIARPDSPEIKLSEVIAALSYALDITEGQPEGHAARSCLFGMRLAREINLDVEQSSALFYALLLTFLNALTQTGVAVCGAGAVEPLAGHTETIGPRN